MANDHRQHLRLARPECHPDADLAAAAAHRVGDHRVDAGARQHQGDERKERDEPDGRDVARKIVVEHLTHRANVIDRLIGIDAPDRLPHPRRCNERVGASTRHQRHADRRALGQRQIQVGLGGLVCVGVADVANHSYDLEPLRIGADPTELDAASDRVSSRPVALHGGLADQRDGAGIGVVAEGQRTPAQQRDPERLEEARADRDRRYPGHVGLRRRRPPLDGDRSVGLAPGQRQMAGPGGALDSRRRLDARQRSIEERGRVGPLHVPRPWKVQLQSEHVVGIEAELDRHQRDHRAHGQAGDDQQDHGQRHLQRRQGAARGRQEAPGPVGSGAATTRLSGRRRQVQARRAQRRHDAEDQRCEQRQPEGKHENCCVDSRLVEQRHVAAGERHQAAQRPVGEDEARDTPQNGQHRALDEQLPHQPPAPGSHRPAQRELLSPRRCAGEQQVGDVGAGNDQDEEHGSAQQREDPRRVGPDHRLAKRQDPCLPSRVRQWELFPQ